MSGSRNISIQIPRCLLEQISKRAVIKNRSRNAEFRYLLDYALGEAGEDDVTIVLGEQDWVKNTTRVSCDTLQVIARRGEEFHRGLSREMVHLVAWGIQLSADRDLELIAAMIQRRDREADGSQSTGLSVSPLVPPA